MSGSIGGMALWTAIFPADVVKSRMQIQGKGSLMTTFMQILREEGMHGKNDFTIYISCKLPRVLRTTAQIFIRSNNPVYRGLISYVDITCRYSRAL